MKTGNSATGFPVLSPLKLDFPMNSSIGFISLEGDLKNMVIEELDSFVVNRLNFNEKTNIMEFDFSWASVRNFKKFQEIPRNPKFDIKPSIKLSISDQIEWLVQVERSFP